MSILMSRENAEEAALGAQARGPRTVAAAIVRVASTLRLWSQRSQQRRRLPLLEARDLADLGLSREEVAFEAHKHFWQR